MKRIILSLGTCLALSGHAVTQAQQFAPSLFASEFCRVMELPGVRWLDAVRHAARMSLDNTAPQAIKVDGTDIDITLSILAAKVKCPQNFVGGWSRQ